MKALTWHGKSDIRCESVPDPQLQHPRDAIIRVTACAICGSDLHIYDGVIPRMETGDIVGHETMGEVVEVGPEAGDLKVGDRVAGSLLNRVKRPGTSDVPPQAHDQRRPEVFAGAQGLDVELRARSSGNPVSITKLALQQGLMSISSLLNGG